MSLLAEHHSNETVTFSSTYIRSCVDAGDMVAATEALGRPHRVEGVVVRGHGRGAELGFPTANVAPPMYSAIPADGVYAAWFTVLGHGPVTGTVVPGERYQAAVSVGTNPTFSGRTRTVEAFVLDTTADLYGQHVALDFVARIRGQHKFDSVQELGRGDGQRHRPDAFAAVRGLAALPRECEASFTFDLECETSFTFGVCSAAARPSPFMPTVKPLLDCRTTSARAAVRGGRALKDS